ncbi:MAG: helix-turn-helix domain-containing protein, partial [Lachnospiraceae bacterium]|nr:helix-turn-helix domain-containing protein [Lachnospiraceae bacterium]
MTNNNCKHNYKHLTTTQRILIEKGLIDNLSFAEIGRRIDKHRSTIAKEVKKYRYFVERDKNAPPLRCARYNQCQMRFLCDKPDCIRPCKNCHNNILRLPQCNVICPD